MLKKISHIIVAFVLLIATTGLTVSKHYCGELLISTLLFSDSDPCCKEGECCHNETAFYQIEEDFAAPGFSQLPHVIDIDLPVDLIGLSLTFNFEKNPDVFIIERDLPPPPNIQKILSLKQAWLL